MGLDAGRAFALAWRVVPRLPDPVARAAFQVVADGAWLVGAAGARQLSANLARLRPDLTDRELRRTVRRGMRSYMRYYCEAFQLPGWSPERLAARARAVGSVELIRAELAADRSVVIALAHAGNWDLAGAWATRAIGPVLTVVERLPGALGEEFLAFRESLGLEIVPLESGSATYRRLVVRATQRGMMIPLLADRDLTKGGVEVSLRGDRARFAVGPAALASSGGHVLIPAVIRHERIHGERRNAAGSPWGIVIDFLEPVPTQVDGERRPVAEITQDWVDAVFEILANSPSDWHMLQKVYLADLDPARLAQAASTSRSAHGQGSAGGTATP